MNQLTQIPEWFGAAVIAAVLAALGYIGKLVMESLSARRTRLNDRRARLIELQSLLQATKVSFAVQNTHAANLCSIIQTRHPQCCKPGDGFEGTISRAYGELLKFEDEKELHRIIRGISMYSLRPGNLALSEWLRRDTYFKAQKPSHGLDGELAAKLAVLEVHLILWHAKYEAWIPDSPEHALVYLIDERQHGIGFPSGIDEIVARMLAKG